MGSKKHKKHHKSDKKEKDVDVPERPEKRLKLVLKVGGSSASEHGDSPHFQPTSIETSIPSVSQQQHSDAGHFDYDKFPEKHKKSKKKKKKKSSEKDKHEKKHKHHHHHHHHSHDKKDRPKRELNDSSQEDMEVDDVNGLCLKRVLFEDDGQDKPFREPRACTLKNRTGKSPLQFLLDFLLKALEKKDPQQFFAWPVTDHIAPGYSSIITHPMDFSTMRQKIENGEFPTIGDFKDDLRLMCENCMMYNRPDTIYFKTAKKMLHIGLKMMMKDKLLPLRHALPFMTELTLEELGFDINDESPVVETEVIEVDENTPEKDIKKKSKPVKPTSKFEAYQDDISPEEILAEAQKAAAAAAAKLTLKRPNTKFGFLRQRQDGSTTLAILNPDEGKATERQLTLEHLTGKLAHGTGALANFREDKRNVAKPITYRNYGPYGSYGPTHDSTFANLTKEESDLLFSTYGDELGMQYAESILNFTRDADFMTTMVDNLLDVLTNGEHTKAMKIIEGKRKKNDEAMKNDNLAKSALKNLTTKQPSLNNGVSATKHNLDSASIDYDSLRSLADLGIDVSFLDDIDKVTGSEAKVDMTIQKKLDETTELLNSLQQAQHNRLSLKPPPHLAHVMEPSSEEIQIAGKVTESLTDMAKQAAPADITSLMGLRKAMGISIEPYFSDGQSNGHNKKTDLQPKSTPITIEDSATDAPAPLQLNQEDAGTDLESELQEFLEADLPIRVSDSPTPVDQTLEESLLV